MEYCNKYSNKKSIYKYFITVREHFTRSINNLNINMTLYCGLAMCTFYYFSETLSQSTKGIFKPIKYLKVQRCQFKLMFEPYILRYHCARLSPFQGERRDLHVLMNINQRYQIVFRTISSTLIKLNSLLILKQYSK